MRGWGTFPFVLGLAMVDRSTSDQVEKMLEPIRLVFVALHIFIVMPLWMSLALRIVDSFLRDQIGDVTSVLKDPATVQKLDL